MAEKVTIQNGWNEWSKYVLKELERLCKGQEQIKIQVAQIKMEIAALKTIWKIIAGAIPIGIGIGIAILQLLK